VTIELPVVSGAANVEAACARCGGERRGVCHHLGQRSDASRQTSAVAKSIASTVPTGERHRFAGTGQYRWTQ
jgi:hypothetical protein